MWRISSLPRPWRTRPLPVLRDGLFDPFPDRNRGQLERYYEGHVTRRVWGWRWLLTQLLRQSVFRPAIFRCIRSYGAIRTCQRGRCSIDETPRRIAQTGTLFLPKRRGFESPFYISPQNLLYTMHLWIWMGTILTLFSRCYLFFIFNPLMSSFDARRCPKFV